MTEQTDYTPYRGQVDLDRLRKRIDRAGEACCDIVMDAGDMAALVLAAEERDAAYYAEKSDMQSTIDDLGDDLAQVRGKLERVSAERDVLAAHVERIYELAAADDIAGYDSALIDYVMMNHTATPLARRDARVVADALDNLLPVAKVSGSPHLNDTIETNVNHLRRQAASDAAPPPPAPIRSEADPDHQAAADMGFKGAPPGSDVFIRRLRAEHDRQCPKNPVAQEVGALKAHCRELRLALFGAGAEAAGVAERMAERPDIGPADNLRQPLIDIHDAAVEALRGYPAMSLSREQAGSQEPDATETAKAKASLLLELARDYRGMGVDADVIENLRARAGMELAAVGIPLQVFEETQS